MLKEGHVPLSVAHQFLTTFGINSPTATYERWIKPDGFDPTDLWHVLADGSPFILNFDWKSCLDELSYLCDAVDKLGTKLTLEVSDHGCAAIITSDDNRTHVKYVPREDDDFANVILSIQGIVPSGIVFREAPHNYDGDGWDFAVLPRDEWSELDSIDSDFTRSFFRPIQRRSDNQFTPRP